MQKAISFSGLRLWMALSLIAGSVFVSYLIFSYARAQTGEPTDQEAASHGITFPIPELGNCASKDECKSYCNDSSHMDACISFAKSHGLMNKDEANRARRFRNDLENGAGPGGCTNPRDCQAFCSDIKNIEVCVKFAEEHGVKDEHIGQARKLLDYIRAGGQTPGSCTSEASCRQYCSDFSHAEECFEFAKKAGITQVRGEVPGEARGRFEGGIPPGQFQKFLELIKRGETPGGCKSKDECEAYCSSGGHFEECVAFGEKVGFVSGEQAAMIRKSGGVGPGGCASRESCEAYCNDQTHREECFKFAEDHGYVNHEDVENTKEGFVRLRVGLEQAPPEIAECLKSTVGPNVLDDIQSGKLTPGPEIGDQVRSCFEKFGRKSNPTEVFKNASPEVLSCLKEKLGGDFSKIQSGGAMPTPEMADTFRVCFEKAQLNQLIIPAPGVTCRNRDECLEYCRAKNIPQSDCERFVSPGFGGQEGQGQGQQGRGQQFGLPLQRAQEFLKHAPPGVATCLKEKLGGKFEKLQSGEAQPIQEFGQTLKSCFEEFRPETEYRGFRSEGEFPVNQKPYFQSVPSFNAPSSGAPSSICAQVITPAKDPSTGYCKPFPTPCDVPSSWVKVSSCEGALPPPTSKTICPAMPTVDSCPAGQVKKVMYSSPECGTYYGCVFETTSPPPPPPGGNLLQIFRPLLLFLSR